MGVELEVRNRHSLTDDEAEDSRRGWLHHNINMMVIKTENHFHESPSPWSIYAFVRQEWKHEVVAKCHFVTYLPIYLPT